MFGFLDNETPRIARLLFRRAQDAESLYGGLPLAELTQKVKADFQEGAYWTSYDQVTFHYLDLRDFSFAFIFMLDEPVLSIQAGGPFCGFMLQRASGRWHVAVSSPMGTPLGRKAGKLAEVFEKEYGVKNLHKLVEAHLRR